jgi:hypothetical protein
MTTAEWITIGAASFNGVVVPAALFGLKAMMRNESVAAVKPIRAELAEHCEEDTEHFLDIRTRIDNAEEKREEQHVENQKLLSKLSTDFDWLKRAILKG